MSPRGSLTLFKDIFIESPSFSDDIKKRKGRSEHHISRRNECLIDRYFFYAKFTGKRYDLVLKTISDEFFLSEVTIPEIIDANYEQLASLKKEQPNKNYFVKRWPHLIW